MLSRPFPAVFMIVLSIAFSGSAHAQDPVATVADEPIGAAQAQAFVGVVKTVCGTVMSARFLDGAESQPTFLNLDQEHPNQTMTVVIFGEDRAKFSVAPETLYGGKKICVTGKIELHRGKPEIIVNDPASIRVLADAPAAPAEEPGDAETEGAAPVESPAE